MSLTMYHLACVLVCLFKAQAVQITDENIIKEEVEKFETALFDATENTGDILDGNYVIKPPSSEPLCDMVLTAPSFFYCDRCLKNIHNIPCNFLIIGAIKKIRLTFRVDGGPKPIEIKVMDALHPTLSDKMDKNVTERLTHVFQSTGDRMYIRLDSARADVKNLQFGFNVHLTTENHAGESGCAKVVTANDAFTLPSGMSNTEASGECYWKLKSPAGSSFKISVPECPSDDTNCYLHYLRIFEGEGTTKRRINTVYQKDKTLFDIAGQVAIVEYYGCPLVSEARIRVRV